MSIEALDRAFKLAHPDMTSTMKLVLLVLADFAGDEDETYPRHNTIATRAMLSRRAVVSNLQKLEEIGIIRATGRTHPTGATRSSVYKLFMTTSVKRDPRDTDKGGGVNEDHTQGVHERHTGMNQDHTRGDKKDKGKLRACKDLNEVKKHLGPERVRELIDNAKPWPVTGLFRLSDYPDIEIPTMCELGLSDELDKLMKFYAGQFVVCTGVPNVGKSTFINQAAVILAKKHKWPVAIFSGEKDVKPFLAHELMTAFRNAQTTVIAPTGTIGLVMDCDTTGIEPDYALVKFKKLAGGGYFKIINQSVLLALLQLG
jgi:Ribonucleotide reductase, barrel domain/Helix-turn-helix domain